MSKKRKTSTTKPTASKRTAPLKSKPTSASFETVELWPQGDPYEGFRKSSKLGAISIVSDACRLASQPQTKPTPTKSSPKLSERPRAEIINGVRCETVSRTGGITIVSDAPFSPPQTNLPSARTPSSDSRLWREEGFRPKAVPDAEASRELPPPELSPMQRFAARSPEEKATFFLLFSRLIKEELELSRRKPN
jgi:hypothetical protein